MCECITFLNIGAIQKDCMQTCEEMILLKRTVTYFVLILSSSSVLFLFWKRLQNAMSDTKFGQRGVVLVIPVPGKTGSGTPFQLHYSDKEFLEWCSSAFCHRNAPDYYLFLIMLDFKGDCIHSSLNRSD